MFRLAAAKLTTLLALVMLSRPLAIQAAVEFRDLQVVSVFKHPHSGQMLIEIQQNDDLTPDPRSKSPSDNAEYTGFFFGSIQTGFYKQNTYRDAPIGTTHQLLGYNPAESVRYIVFEPNPQNDNFRERVAYFTIRKDIHMLTTKDLYFDRVLAISCDKELSCPLGSKADIEAVNRAIHSGEAPLFGLPNVSRIKYILKHLASDSYIIIERHRLNRFSTEIEIFEGGKGNFVWRKLAGLPKETAQESIYPLDRSATLHIPKQFNGALAEISYPHSPKKIALEVKYQFDEKRDEQSILEKLMKDIGLPEARYRIYNYHSPCLGLWNKD